MNAPQYGDRRIVVWTPGDELQSSTATDDTFPPDLLRTALAGKPPWAHGAVQIYRGTFLGWETISSAQRTPMPGWAHPAATYCRTCGVVAFDGAELPCGCASHKSDLTLLHSYNQ
jgi:hypothetical protein